MAFRLLAVSDRPLELEAAVSQVEAIGRTQGEGIGALCTFVGVVRATHKGRAVRYLDYEAHAALAVRAFEHIAEEVNERWPLALLAIHHRTGRIEIGQASVIIVSAAAHRDEAFRVNRYGIERVKQIAPVWKHEFFDDGDAWVEGPLADPSNDAMRRQAMEIACG